MSSFLRKPIRRWRCWLCAGLLFLCAVATARSEDQAAPGTREPQTSAAPSLADVVYQAGALDQRLDALKLRIDSIDDLHRTESRLARATSRADAFQARLDAINADDLQSYQQLASLKGEIRNESEEVDQSVEPLMASLQRVEAWRRTWLAEKQRWQRWRASLGTDLALKSVADALDGADADVDKAIGLISRKLEPMLAVQRQAGENQTRINGLIERIDTIMARQVGGALRGGTPTMFSYAYLRQLIDIITEPHRLMVIPSLPDPAFFSEKGWVIGIQLVLFMVLFSLIRRHRERFLERAGRRFLGKRQMAAPLFVAIFTLAPFYGPQPDAWRMLIQVLACVATARLVTAFVQHAWIKRAITVLVLVVVMFQTLLVISIPLAPMRLFILSCTIIAGIYFGWRARYTAAAGQAQWQVWLFRLAALVFTVIAAADIIGFGGFAVQLMDSALRAVVLLLMGWVMIRLARVALELIVESLPIRRLAFWHANAEAILSRITALVNVLIGTFVAANLLVALKLYALPAEALHDFFGFGLTVGGHEITIGLVLVAGLILYGAFVFSWGLQNLLMQNILSRGHMDTGVRLSIVRLVHYALVLVGFLVALSAMGFELKNITIIGGALGVGIGFGMQAIVNNFVSGLILLFERPIKVGDVIELGDGQQGRVTNLGLRATTVQTFNRAEVVVPNGDLISSQVTNWTLGDRSMRLIVPVGVAYGSDVETVMRVLMTVATENEIVLKDPQPMVLFLNFGDSSLDFQLRVWIPDFNDRRIIQSALIREIDQRFRIEGVEIPFPQRDLHLRSVDGDAAAGLKGMKKGDTPP